MIARTWHGRVPAAKAEAYHQYLLRTGVADYRATPGNRGVLVQRRVEGDVAHFLLTTLWDSLDAIKRFAGEDYEAARYYPEDDNYLLEREPHVAHAEALLVVLPAEETATAGGLLSTGGLAPSATGATVRVSGRKVVVTDGPFAESKEIVGG